MPFLEQADKSGEVIEERIEVLPETARLEEVLTKLREVHPYEEPAIEVYPLLYPN